MKPLNPDQIRKILIRGTNWVGDAVISVPAMREIRRLFPQARITLLVRPWVKDVYSAVDFVDEVLEFDKKGIHRGLKGFQRMASEIRLRGFDLAILLQNAIEAALLSWRAWIPRRIGYARDGRSVFLTDACKIDPEVHRVHQVYYYLGILSAAGLLPPRLWQNRDYRPSIRIEVRDVDRDGARQMLRENGVESGETLIAINPGAFYGWAKRWLSDRYAKVADSLADRCKARIAILGSTGERQIAKEIAQQMKHPALILAGQTTLGQLMGLIKECRLLITNDSGPMHLAAALDVPQVAIFGSTSEIATGPLSPYSQVVKHPVECSPCFLRECPIDFRCMTRVTVEQVLGAAEGSLKRY